MGSDTITFPALRMKALVITQFELLPIDQAVDGIFRRQAMFLRALAAVSQRIDFVFFRSDAQRAAMPDLAAVDAAQSAHWGCPFHAIPVPIAQRQETLWRHYGAAMLSVAEQYPFYRYAGPEQVAAVARALADKPDVIYVLGLGAMAAVLRSGLRPARLFFDLNDLEHKMRLRSALEPPFWPGKLIYCMHAPAILLAEWRAARRGDGLFVCSEPDAAHLRRLGFGAKAMVVPNALPMPADPPPPAASPTVMFIGTYTYQPNRDATERLVDRIWPLIHARVPDARLIIAGKGTQASRHFANPPAGVEFAGFVDDLDALYARTRIVACPIMVGGGTRLKLIEAASYARPMVSTRIGAEGLELEDGSEILLRDDDAAFATACAELLLDDALCARLGMAARRKALALYDTLAVERLIVGILRGARS